MLLQSLRMTWRDWRAGELRFLLIALVIAVGALSSVGFFVDRVSHGLQRDANQLLGADLVISSDEPISASINTPLYQLTQHLRQAETASFVSMVMTNSNSDQESQSKLVSVKAVSDQYPLRGQLMLETGKVLQQIPAPGTAWVDQAVLNALNLQLGQQLKLGDQLFTVTHIVKEEPDRSSSYINFAPRVMIAKTDLAATNLVQPGSRISYRLMLAGSAQQIVQIKVTLEELIATHRLTGVNLESLESTRPEMNSTLTKAKQFLSLVSLLSAMLAALAIALAARRFMLRHINACAMLRCLGLNQTQVTVLYLFEFVALGIFASSLGAGLGYLGHLVLLLWLGSFIETALPPPSTLPALQGMAFGMLLLIGFAIPPILQLRNVPHNLMMRRQMGPPRAHTIFAYLAGIVIFAILLVWQTGNLYMAGYTLVGFLTGVVFFAGCAWLFLYLLRYTYDWFHFPAWHFAIKAVQRRPVASVVQVVSLALGLMALLLLTVIRSDLLSAWRHSTPPDAPNQFVVNILPEQKEQVATMLAQHHVASPKLYPMMRGRLISVNNRAVTAKDYDSENAQRLVDREFNLSTMEQLQNHNRIIAGSWFDRQNPKPEASVEEGIAKTMKLKLGDALRFDVGGQQINVRITSLRKLSWDSMQVNFFVIVDPFSAIGLTQTWITAFHLPKNEEILVNKLSRQFPNLSIIDTGVVLFQVQRMLDQVASAVQFLFLFTLVSGILVLYAALQSSQQERLQEASLLRALGASTKQLSSAQWAEYTLLGSLAGMLAASGAALIGWVLADQVFDFTFQPTPLLWVIGLAAGAVCAFAGGWLGLHHILKQPPLLSLREGQA